MKPLEQVFHMGPYVVCFKHITLSIRQCCPILYNLTTSIILLIVVVQNMYAIIAIGL